MAQQEREMRKAAQDRESALQLEAMMGSCKQQLEEQSQKSAALHVGKAQPQPASVAPSQSASAPAAPPPPQPWAAAVAATGQQQPPPQQQAQQQQPPSQQQPQQ